MYLLSLILLFYNLCLTLFGNMKRNLRLRWVLFFLAIAAVSGLTAMNIYSLYALHDSTVNASIDNRKNQLVDFSYTVRNRFRSPIEGIWRLNVEQIDQEFQQRAPLNKSFAQVLNEASNDPIYNGIYFTYPGFSECGAADSAVFKFDQQKMDLVQVFEIPETVCDGFGLTRTRMRVLLSDYRWNTKVVFDTHRSMTVALINPRDHRIVGYFNFMINQENLVNDFFAKELAETFGTRHESGMVVWLHDWLKNEILASTDQDMKYDRRSVNYIQRFPDLMDNWNLKVSFVEGSTIIASQSNLTRNLIVLSGGVLLLITSLVIIFRISQKEKDLADRQSGFLANVTHELKTPLAVMQAAGENLADGRVNDPQRLRAYGEHIHTEAMRLRSMIDKLLDVAKNDSGQLVINPVSLSIGQLIREYILESQTSISAAGFEPIVEIDPDVSTVLVDKESFRAILSNLVENAIKYSPDEKYLAIRVKKNGTFVQMDVEDHGLGIPMKAQRHIFDKFYRVEDTLTAQTKGHGLGLSIVKVLTEMNGGRIFVQSNYRIGSVFSVHLPMGEVSTTSEKATSTSTSTSTSETKIEYAS
jgi:signal transduction histidine kinase